MSILGMTFVRHDLHHLVALFGLEINVCPYSSTARRGLHTVEHNEPPLRACVIQISTFEVSVVIDGDNPKAV